MSIEIMLNSAGLAFITAGAHWAQPDGQVMFLFILAVAAAEAAVGLGILLAFYRNKETVNIDEMNIMRW